MSFSNYKLDELKQILKDFKNFHDIRGGHKMKKDKLINELSKNFELEAGVLYATNPKLIGGSRNSGYVQKLEAQNKINIKKIKKPSAYMLRKYGNHPEIEYEEPSFSLHDLIPDFNDIEVEHHKEPIHKPNDKSKDKPLFKDDEVVEYNVGKSKKDKNVKHINDEEAERIAEEKEMKQVEESRKKKLEVYYKKLIKNVRAYEKKAYDLKNDYTNDLEKLKKLRQTKANKELYEKRIKEDVQNKKKLKEEYSSIFEYCNKHKLNTNNLDKVIKYLNEQLQDLKH